MPNYSAIHTELIENMAQTLPLFAPARPHRGDNGYGYLVKLRAYMLEHEENVNGITMDLSNIINFTSKKILTGCGMRMTAPDFNGTFTKNLPIGIQNCAASLQKMLNDQGLMEREPMLRAYLRFAKTQFDRAKTDHWDVYGYLSDSCALVMHTIFSQMRTLPTAAQLQQLQQSNPGAYQAAVSIMNLFNAFSDCYAAELLTDPRQAEQKKSAATEAELRRRHARLEHAARAFANIPREDVLVFFRQTGNEAGVRTVDDFLFNKYLKSNNPQDIFAMKAADQLARQRALLDQGLSLEETRLLWDCNAFFHTFRSDLGGANIKYRDMVEPFASQLEQMDQLARQCAERFQNGFASVQEKNEFFKTLGTVYGQLTNSLLTIPLDETHYDVSIPEESIKLANTVNNVMRTFRSEYEAAYGLLSRVDRMKQRIIGLEQTEKWNNRARMGPAWQLLKDSGSAGLGPKDTQGYQDYQQMLALFRDLAGQMGKPTMCQTQRMALGENCRRFGAKAESWLGSAFEKLQNRQPPLPQAERQRTEQRVIGTLGVLHALYPEKAEALRRKACTALGRELGWNEIQSLSLIHI